MLIYTLTVFQFHSSRATYKIFIQGAALRSKHSYIVIKNWLWYIANPEFWLADRQWNMISYTIDH